MEDWLLLRTTRTTENHGGGKFYKVICGGAKNLQGYLLDKHERV